MTPLKQAGSDLRMAQLEHDRDKLQRLVDHNLANWDEVKQLYETKRELQALEERCQLSDSQR